ncbi:hypothetical protein GW17_00059258 [Ensete ventricosum]|nr:hypothetical protein GW17_00059258 [Ensete ventricosum]
MPSICFLIVWGPLTYWFSAGIVIPLFPFDSSWLSYGGGPTGLNVNAYCLFYYCALSYMSGFMQTSFFGYGWHLLWLLPNAWYGWLLHCFAVRSSHLLIHQVW